jgi:hypothetical protein
VPLPGALTEEDIEVTEEVIDGVTRVTLTVKELTA